MALWNVVSLLLIFRAFSATNGSTVKLNNGGYEDIVIAINPSISEDIGIIENIQKMVKEASPYLFRATNKRLFIRTVKILIPSSWSSNSNYTKLKTEAYNKVGASLIFTKLWQSVEHSSMKQIHIYTPLETECNLINVCSREAAGGNMGHTLPQFGKDVRNASLKIKEDHQTTSKDIFFIFTCYRELVHADVIIANPFLKNGDDPYTLQYKGCGEKGEYIHLTPNYLLDDNLISIYGPRGRVFVHEWAHLRWGVFDEYSNEKPYYISRELKIEGTRCSADITGTNKKQQCQENSCSVRDCNVDYKTGLYEDGCTFIPEMNQFVRESIMYSQALSSVSEFCNDSNHNIEAPNLQNRLCNSHSTWDVIMNSTDIKSSSPMNDTTIPSPSFTLMQYKDRVVTLAIDVSESMVTRIGRLYQAADIFLTKIVETGAHVGIVEFLNYGFKISPLLHITSEVQREQLKLMVPTTVSSEGSNICAGILSALEVNKEFDGTSTGTEVILLVDGEDMYISSNCFDAIKASGATIHVISLGPEATKDLEQIADITGGMKYFVTDKVDANDLIDAFSAIQVGNGDTTQKVVQLESTASNLKTNECLNGTVSIDSTVGNETSFLVTWQISAPVMTLQDPSGVLFTGAKFTSDNSAKLSRLEIPGTAESGRWHYSLCNNYTLSQVLGIVVISKAANENVPPVTVIAHMNTDINQFPNPMVVYASVNQGYLPVKGAHVTAIIQPEIGNSIILELLDNGAGADIIKNDGIYSRYFYNFTTNGRYSLKVRVENKDNNSSLTLPRSGAYYIPGYVENGKITMNPPKSVDKEDDFQRTLGPFVRFFSSGSFLVYNMPSNPKQDIYKPAKITDLEAQIEMNKIVLSWTATGQNLDQGKASRYDLRMSTEPKDLRDHFENAVTVDISMFTPQSAGSTETFIFVPQNIVIENGTIFYFAIVAFNKALHKSEQSNIAQVAFLIPKTPEYSTFPPSTQQSNTTDIINVNRTGSTPTYTTPDVPITNNITSNSTIPFLSSTIQTYPSQNRTSTPPGKTVLTPNTTVFPIYTTPTLNNATHTSINSTLLMTHSTPTTARTTPISAHTTPPPNHNTSLTTLTTLSPTRTTPIPTHTKLATTRSTLATTRTIPKATTNNSSAMQSKTILAVIVCFVAACQLLLSEL